MNRQDRTARNGLPLTYILFPVVVVVVVAAGVGLVVAFDGGSGDGGSTSAATVDDATGLPAYALAAPPEVQAAYRFVAEHPDVMAWIPCYCGCGGHSGHTSAKDCFVSGSGASGVQFDAHGAGCDVCVNIALDTKMMIEEGRSLRDVRAFIDEKYSSVGPGTDTPYPPE